MCDRGGAQYSGDFDEKSPGVGQEDSLNKTREALRVMRTAVEIGEWERGMTHESLIPYLREESEEFAEAVRAHANNPSAQAEQQLKAELSDVLLQVLFHAELARRRGAFDFEDVAEAFVDKLRSRAPYLFDGTTRVVPIAEQERLWQEGKAREKS
ncbi:MazG nucleotide pyrophosphohydrolase domain-containing protein [Staphylococcus chromogenes]|nr:MazG nucleotide pyrophosphohydrolase domain-containing protein [Staphylococcus chromogenes]